MAFMHDTSSTITSSVTNAIKTLIHNVLPSKTRSLEDTSNNMLPLVVYNEIRSILNADSPSTPFRHFKDFPHPDPAHVLSCQATSVQHIKIKGRDYSTFKQHHGNSSIGYYCSSASGEIEISAGFIDTIWRQTLDGVTQTFLVVSPHQFLSSEDHHRNPYQGRNGFQVEIAYTNPSASDVCHVIRQSQVIGHIAYYKRPPGTFGIQSGITILINSLHRNRE
jgi:hypothetical protein